MTWDHSIVMPLAILFAATMAASPTPAAVLATLPPALAAAVRDYDDAQINGDTRAFDRLLADDYALVNSRAQVENKAQMIADYTAPGFHLAPYVVEQPIVRLWSGGAVVGGEVALSGTSDGAPFTGRIRFADVWRLRGGRWQVVFTEVTPVK
ncbi:MAG: nuclear transport factor 2 family protein [Sphingomonas sp.]|uniref:nuclear transport factor 2 family protein n=1 Tax=Sphingomonas sp. TaxID=28214 RepID=UPI001AC05154|nr:nuclear transport factor 2 family protein [Sphingomonas sp.]MBN8809392.1 nuclear transport factor 2 family protein [Sphingomonas sp.]